MSHVAVIDIGKTNAKLVLVDAETGTEIAGLTRPNTVLPGPPWPHYDVEGHWDFILRGLGALHRAHGVKSISVTTHGAAGVLLDDAGGLAAPVLDYEHDGPDSVAPAYDAIRPAFEETGSPRLPGGLNLGAQLFWMFATDPGLSARTRHVLTYPQYWGYRLTGGLACDVSSLGCHTDLWSPKAGGFSSLVARLGLTGKMAPARPSAEALGTLKGDVARATGLDPETPVACGIHDSNASLLPHILGRAAPFSVVSTGTWVVAMGVGSATRTLDPARDALINVSALGDPVPSARFMGGRAFDLITAGQPVAPDDADIADVLAKATMLQPAVVEGSGPFPDRAARWLNDEPAPGTGARTVAASFYLALMTATCLELIGHRGTVVVEGPFAQNPEFCRMLQAATGSEVARHAGSTGTSLGAAMLTHMTPPDGLTARDMMVRDASVEMAHYAKIWRHAL